MAHELSHVLSQILQHMSCNLRIASLRVCKYLLKSVAHNGSQIL
jgi:hypothetical protein